MKTYQREEFLLLQAIEVRYLELFKEHEAFVAGGSITSVFSGRRINDYDVYFTSQSKFNECSLAFLKLRDKKECELVFSTPNAKSYTTKEGIKIQLISAVFGTPEHIFDNFDFTCCMGAYDFSTKSFSFQSEFMTHLSQRRLVFNTKSKYPLSSLVRARKYLGRGFAIDAIQMVKLALSIHKLNLSDYSVLREQLMGVDISLFKTFLDKLENQGSEPYDFEQFVSWIEDLYGDLNNEDEQ